MNTNKQKLSTIGLAAKRELFLARYIENNFNVSRTCRELGMGRTAFYKWCKNSKFKQKVEDLEAEWGENVVQALYENATLSKDSYAQIFICRTKLKHLGFVEGEAVSVRQKADQEAVKLLDELLSGDKDVKTVALEFTKAGIPLPESVKILLAKEPPEEDAGDGSYRTFSDEELEARYVENLEAGKAEREAFLPQRKKDVEELKEELKDHESFAENSEAKGVE